MKRWTNDRRRRAALSAAVAAAALVMPAAAEAAPVGTNLVVNGDFESVDITSTGNYNGPRILAWSGLAAFAYSHDGSSSSLGVVPDYADGADPPGAGHWYFSSNNEGPNGLRNFTDPADFFQDIDVSAGPSGALIASGAARYNLSAFMSSYLNDGDFGNVQVEFFNAGGNSLGTAMISDGDPGPDNVWSLSALAGAVPLGTGRVRVSVYGTPVNAGPDGYIDNVSFSIVPEPSALGVLGGALALMGLTRRRRRDGP